MRNRLKLYKNYIEKAKKGDEEGWPIEIGWQKIRGYVWVLFCVALGIGLFFLIDLWTIPAALIIYFIGGLILSTNGII